MQGEINSITLMTNNSILLLGFWFRTITDRPVFFSVTEQERMENGNEIVLRYNHGRCLLPLD